MHEKRFVVVERWKFDHQRHGRDGRQVTPETRRADKVADGSAGWSGDVADRRGTQTGRAQTKAGAVRNRKQVRSGAKQAGRVVRWVVRRLVSQAVTGEPSDESPESSNEVSKQTTWC